MESNGSTSGTPHSMESGTNSDSHNIPSNQENLIERDFFPHSPVYPKEHTVPDLDSLRSQLSGSG